MLVCVALWRSLLGSVADWLSFVFISFPIGRLHLLLLLCSHVCRLFLLALLAAFVCALRVAFPVWFCSSFRSRFISGFGSCCGSVCLAAFLIVFVVDLSCPNLFCNVICWFCFG